MAFNLIWVISFGKHDGLIEIEFFSGQNKYTKAGLFSGPLRSIDAKDFTSNPIVMFLSGLSNAAQIGKNKFLLHDSDAALLFTHLCQSATDSAYVRLADKKLHHIDQFVSGNAGKCRSSICFDDKNRILYYISIQPEQEDTTTLITIPGVNLFLCAEDKCIRGYLTFSYQNREIPANSPDETIILHENTAYRNLGFEQIIVERLYAAGGHRSQRNEIVFPLKTFWQSTFPMICQEQINLFWGKDRQPIFKSSFSCKVSYGIDWFTVSGQVASAESIYSLSELLHASRGKSFVKIDDGLLFFPEELRKIAQYATGVGEIKVPPKKLNLVNDLAAHFDIDASAYLNRFLDFSDRTCTVNEHLKQILKPYQKSGVSWISTLYQNGFGGCLADDMGLGKTLQTIAFLGSSERKSDRPTLVIVPKIVLFNWENEMNKYDTSLEYSVVYGTYSYCSIGRKNVVYLTTYATLVNHIDEFSNVDFDTIVLDESQNIKNHRTMRYKAIRRLTARFILALTGTPIENNIDELWSLLDLLNPGLFGNHRSFTRKYGDAHSNPSAASRLKSIISPFILRRTKEEVLLDLPPKEEKYIYCEMDVSQRELYSSILASAQKELSSMPSRYTIKDNAAILEAILYLREICSDPQLLPPNLRYQFPCDSCKFELFQEFVQRIMSEVGKVIVFSLFPKVLQKMEAWCKQNHWKTFYIDGSVNNRQDIVDDFENSKQGIFFISLKAGGVGLNLTSCQYVFIYDPWWNSAAEQQASNRVYRIGQEKPVFIYHFLVKDSIEEKIFELQKIKNQLFDDIINELNPSATVTIEDLRQLLL